MAAIAIDNDSFLNTGLETSATVGAATISVQFDNARQDERVGDQDVYATGPRCWTRTSDVSGLAIGGSITIGGTAYTVIDQRPDGVGMTELVLEE